MTGTGWGSGESVDIQVDDDQNRTWSLNSDPDPVAGASGGLTYEFTLPTHFVATYTIVATGSSGATATVQFADGSSSTSVSQNDADNNSTKENCNWVDGNLDGNHNVWNEGDAVPQRLIQQIDGIVDGDAAPNAHSIVLSYAFTNGSTYAYDFLTTPNLTQEGALLNPCGSTVHATECAAVASGAFPPAVAIPSDPFDAVASREYPASRFMAVDCDPNCVGPITVTFVDAPSIVNDGEPNEAHDPDTDPDCFQNCGTSDVFIQINFTAPDDTTVTLGAWWAVRLASTFTPVEDNNTNPLAVGWGLGCGGVGEPCGAGNISGNPFHMRYECLDPNPNCQAAVAGTTRCPLMRWSRRATSRSSRTPFPTRSRTSISRRAVASAVRPRSMTTPAWRALMRPTPTR